MGVVATDDDRRDTRGRRQVFQVRRNNPTGGPAACHVPCAAAAGVVWCGVTARVNFSGGVAVASSTARRPRGQDKATERNGTDPAGGDPIGNARGRHKCAAARTRLARLCLRRVRVRVRPVPSGRVVLGARSRTARTASLPLPRRIGAEISTPRRPCF